MAKMFRAYRPADVIGDFSGTQIVSDHARAVTDGARHFIEIRRGDNNEWIRYPVDYVIGSKWQQAYATRLPDSRLLVFPIQYSRLRSAWVNYWGWWTRPGSPRTDISQFHRAPADAVYQTTLRAVPHEPVVVREGRRRTCSRGVPRRRHQLRDVPWAVARSRRAAEERRHSRVDGARRHPISFRRLPAERYVAVCAQCHAQSAVHDAQPGGAVNYSETGDPFRTYAVELPSAFSRKAFYRDGRYRATTFISEAFARSQCFRKGQRDVRLVPRSASVQCRAESELAEIRARCRRDVRAVPHDACASGPNATHAMRPAPKRAAACRATCRASWRPLLFQARSHEIDDIPDAEMTERFGNADSPNACSSCHADRDAAWLRTSLAAFRPRSRGVADPPTY